MNRQPVRSYAKLDISALQIRREPRHRVSLLVNDFDAVIEEMNVLRGIVALARDHCAFYPCDEAPVAMAVAEYDGKST